MTSTLRHLIALAAGATALVAGPTIAAAAESPAPPRHLGPYGLDWLNYVARDDLPPSRPAVCIVDTGLLVTPDTPADSPDGPVLERRATDGGSGAPQGTSGKHVHGTSMAMAAIAAANDWGTIGTASWSRVTSVRAAVDGEQTLRANAYKDGINLCVNAAERYPVAVISLSFGCAGCEFSPDQEALALDAIGTAHDSGISVIAAAGNDPAAPTQAPARFPGVLAVGAGSASSGLCAYSTYDQRVDLLGPACPIDGADPLTGAPFFDESGGSSTATAVTAAAVAALRTLRPDASYTQVERWLRDGARVVDGRRFVDLEAAARLAGLGAVVDRARARMPSPAPQPSDAPPPPSPSAPQQPSTAQSPAAPPTSAVRRLAAPRRVRATWRRGRLTVAAAGRPSRVALQVVAEYVGELGLAVRRVRRSRVAGRVGLRLASAPNRVIVRFVSGREFGPPDSKPVTLIRARSGRFRQR